MEAESLKMIHDIVFPRGMAICYFAINFFPSCIVLGLLATQAGGIDSCLPGFLKRLQIRALTCGMGLEELNAEEDCSQDGVDHQVHDPDLGRHQVTGPVGQSL
jgi:hypothetical protein